MKFTKLQIMLALMVSALMFNACKDDPVNPTDDPSSYFQFKAGNYWVYKSDSLDINQMIVPGTSTTDSTVDVGIETKSGKSANKLVTYYSDNSNEDNYYALDGSKLFTFFADVAQGGVTLPISNWMLIADFGGTSWTVLDTNISQDMGMGILNAKVTVVGSKGTQKTITVGSTGIACQEFIQKITVAGKITISGIPIPIDINLTITSKQYFGKNVGLVQILQETTKLTIPGLGDQIIQGYISTLQRYKV
jgi:hypothetical protein